jgi:hypothetical protein
MVMFNNEAHRKEALMYRDWGRIGDNSELMADRFNHMVDGIPYDHKFLYGCLGYNFKSSEVNAAFGLVQLEKFEKFRAVRRANFERYIENLKDIPQILLPSDKMKPNWLAIPLQCKDRLALLEHLENRREHEDTSSYISRLRNISLTHNQAHDGLWKVLPETVLSKTEMENHGQCEHHLMDCGPPRPVLRANRVENRAMISGSPAMISGSLRSRIACDDLGVPAIANPPTRHEPTVDRMDSPKDSFAVRRFLDTLQHELIARPALVALRHDVRWNTNTTRLIYVRV